MNKRKVYHVAPKKGSGWKVQAEGTQRPTRIKKTKEDAVQEAKDLAKRQKPSQVIIHKKDGTIQTEYTYGEDPHPPEG